MDTLVKNACPRHRVWLPAALCVWFAAVLVGWVVLSAHSLTPGAIVAPPSLSETNLPIPQTLDGDRYLLVMAIHPKCPCTHASANELARLMTRFYDRLGCVVLVYRPVEEKDEWTDTRLVRNLHTEPNTHLIIDADGKQADRLGMTTSGSVVLYMPDGEPCYWGGITAARGHEGDNLGSDAVAAILDGREPDTISQPVFGCRIQAGVDEGDRGDR